MIKEKEKRLDATELKTFTALHLMILESDNSWLPFTPRGKDRAMVDKAFATRAIALLLFVPLLSVQATHDPACSVGDGSLMSLDLF